MGLGLSSTSPRAAAAQRAVRRLVAVSSQASPARPGAARLGPARAPGPPTLGLNKAAAQAIGKAIAEKAIAAGIKEVCFDRGHNRYHGRVAALADAAREAGLSF